MTNHLRPIAAALALAACQDDLVQPRGAALTAPRASGTAANAAAGGSLTWYLAAPGFPSPSSFSAVPFGLQGDEPVPADYDGDGLADVGVSAPIASRDVERLVSGSVFVVAGRREGGRVEEIPADRLRVGDVVLVRPGDRVPCDGTIEEGRSALDESPVTGESVPVARGPGEPVVAGSINADGVLRVRVTRAAADNTVARIVKLVEEASAARAPSQRLVERFARWWTPGAMAASLLVILVPPLLFGGDWWTWTYRGLALLLIACPCALVISVPAGPPSGGLYLKPPSRGGLWLGVTTMPSERPGSSSARARLYVRIAWLSAGVGTHESRESTRTSTPFATSTSIAECSAGSDRPCVSRPRNSGPRMPCAAR